MSQLQDAVSFLQQRCLASKGIVLGVLQVRTANCKLYQVFAGRCMNNYCMYVHYSMYTFTVIYDYIYIFDYTCVIICIKVVYMHANWSYPGWHSMIL